MAKAKGNKILHNQIHLHQLKTITLPHDFSDFSEVIDVRSPQEYEIDHIPGSINLQLVNLPTLTNEQRKEVGSIYKDNPFEARKIGASYISNNASQHLANHLAKKNSSYRPLLYCWRGGMRSRAFTFILQSIGWDAHLISGGYRAFRKYNVTDLTKILENPNLHLQIFSGLTGTGKTRLLHELKNQGAQVLDLEALANHKGSLLGNTPNSPQPTQKSFETNLWNTLKEFDSTKPIYTEAESNRIGTVHCPPTLWKKLSEGTTIHLELNIHERAKLLAEDYPHFIENPTELSQLLNTLRRIRGDKQIELWQSQIKNNDWSIFLTSILENHYDLAYRIPGHEKSNYSLPSTTHQIPDCTQKSYHQLAKEIIG